MYRLRQWMCDDSIAPAPNVPLEEKKLQYEK